MIDDLFASLRKPDADPAAATAQEPARSPEAPSAVAPEPAAESPPVSEPKAVVAALADGPLDLRDRRLFPVTNDVLRAIKREIVDLQNAVLEELRTESGEWRPKKAMFQPVLGQGAAGLAARSYGEGVAAAGELAEQPAPDLPDQSSHDLSSVVTDLWEAVVDAIDGSVGGGNRERGASVGRVFRAWRTDEAERRVRSVAHAEYNAGVAAGLAALGLRHSIVPAGRDIADPDSTVIPAP